MSTRPRHDRVAPTAPYRSSPPSKRRAAARGDRDRAMLTARTADRFDLYERSVQTPDSEIEFIDRVYGQAHGRRPRTLREDFCGTGYLCAEWVGSRSDRTAVGLDLDQPTLDVGLRRHVRALGDAAARVRLERRDVLQAEDVPAEVIVAFNFSYCVFKTRSVLRRYFAGVRTALDEGGVFLLDVYGGPDAQTELVERKRMRGFTYIWDQRPYDALTGQAVRYIHFGFRDGSEMRRAFTYDWRIWSLPELRDLLEEVGFARVEVYWEGSDARGHGNGVFRKVARADNEQAWIAYVLAWR